MKLSKLMLWLGGVVGLAAAGCGRAPAPPPEPDPTIHVLAVVYPMADIVRQIGGPWVSVDWVVEGSHDPRDVQGTQEERKKVEWANLIISSGFDDAWATRDMTDAYRDERMFYLDTMPTGREETARTVGQAALWLDPQVVSEASNAIAERLCVRDPTHASEYRSRAAALREELRHLVEEHSKKIVALPEKKFLVIRPAWSAMANRFGLREIHPIDAQIERVTSAQARTLREAAAVEEVHLLVLDSAPPPAVAHDLQDRTQLTLLPLDLVGSSASGGHRTYQELMRYDLEQLEAALK